MDLKKFKKKGVFDQMGALAIGLVSLGIILIVVFLILSNLASNTDVVADGNASAAVTTMQSAGEDIPGWAPIVVIVAIGALLIFMVRRFR